MLNASASTRVHSVVAFCCEKRYINVRIQYNNNTLINYIKIPTEDI